MITPSTVPPVTDTGTSMGNGAPTDTVALMSPSEVAIRDTSIGMGSILFPCSHSVRSDDRPSNTRSGSSSRLLPLSRRRTRPGVWAKTPSGIAFNWLSARSRMFNDDSPSNRSARSLVNEPPSSVSHSSDVSPEKMPSGKVLKSLPYRNRSISEDDSEKTCGSNAVMPLASIKRYLRDDSPSKHRAAVM